MKSCMRSVVWLIAAWAAGAGAVQAQGPGRNFISVTTTPGLVNFTLRSSGISPGSAPVTITTTWRLGRGSAQLAMTAYFSNPAAALTSAPGGRIPSSRVSGRVNGGAFSPFTGAGPFSVGGSLTIFTQRARGNRRRTRTDTLDLQIDTTALNLAPGVYSGVLRIQALAL